MLFLPSQLESLRRQSAHHLCTLWRIERTDNVILRFTTHDCQLLFNVLRADAQTLLASGPGGVGTDELYTPVDSFSATAREKLSGIKDQNAEITGVISSEAITDDDLRAGRYREAKVVEMLVDWRFPGYGYFFKNNYYITTVWYAREIWDAQISGLPTWMRRDNGSVLSNMCRFKFGDPKSCAVNLEALAVAGTVSSVTTPNLTFVAAGLPVPDPPFEGVGVTAPNYYDYGQITWTAGLNIGLTTDVKHNDGTNIYLQLTTPFAIQVGDTFSIIPGCDHTRLTCANKFANLNNFGGFPFIPGNDKMLRGPQ